MFSKRFKMAGAAVLIAGAVGAGGYFWRGHATTGHPSAGPSNTAPAAVPVTAANVTQGDVPIVLEGLGAVSPLNTATIRTQVQGTLESVEFVEGQEVKRGQVLARIDPRDVCTPVTRPSVMAKPVTSQFWTISTPRSLAPRA